MTLDGIKFSHSIPGNQILRTSHLCDPISANIYHQCDLIIANMCHQSDLLCRFPLFVILSVVHLLWLSRWNLIKKIISFFAGINQYVMKVEQKLRLNNFHTNWQIGNNQKWWRRPGADVINKYFQYFSSAMMK